MRSVAPRGGGFVFGFGFRIFWLLSGITELALGIPSVTDQRELSTSVRVVR